MRGDVVEQIQGNHLTSRAVKEEFILEVAKAIEFCGRQGISLRGHRDGGRLTMANYSELYGDTNEGNFRTLLRYRAEGMPPGNAIATYTQSCPSNELYTSWWTQNKLIEFMADQVVTSITSKITAAKFFLW